MAEGGWCYHGWAHKAGRAPGSHTQCSHMENASVCRGELGATQLNLEAGVTGQQEGVVEVTAACRDPAAADGAAAASDAAAGVDAETACGGAGDPMPPPPQPQSGPHAPAPHQAPWRHSLLLPPLLPASAAAASSAVAAGTMSHM